MFDFDDDNDVFDKGKTLLIDGDILVYKPCCIFTDDDLRTRKLLAENIKGKIGQLLKDSGCDSYIIYLTTSLNFRNFVSGDYKANRVDVERPVHLTWAKHYATKTLGAESEPGLEADDLLAINQTEDTVIWSPDKDLMNVPGMHLDDATNKLIEVSDNGEIWKDKKGKWRFSGFKGLMFQALVGDTADYIIGCAKRVEKTYGPKAKRAGEKYLSRVGVGPSKAAKILNDAPQNPIDWMLAIRDEYYKEFEDKWQAKLEQQVNLLFMVNEFDSKSKLAKRWTFDGRDEYMDILTGEITYGNTD